MIETNPLKLLLIAVGGLFMGIGLITLCGMNPFTWGTERTNYKMYEVILVLGFAFFVIGSLL